MRHVRISDSFDLTCKVYGCFTYCRIYDLKNIGTLRSIMYAVQTFSLMVQFVIYLVQYSLNTRKLNKVSINSRVKTFESIPNLQNIDYIEVADHR